MSSIANRHKVSYLINPSRYDITDFNQAHFHDGSPHVCAGTRACTYTCMCKQIPQHTPYLLLLNRSVATIIVQHNRCQRHELTTLDTRPGPYYPTQTTTLSTDTHNDGCKCDGCKCTEAQKAIIFHCPM